MSDYGDTASGSALQIYFTTHDSTGALVAPSVAFTNADFRVYKDGSAVEKTSTNGIVVTSPFDGVVGTHLVEIDQSNNTGDTGFFAAGSNYRVVINSAKTIGGIAQSGVRIAYWSCENRNMKSDVQKYGGTAGTFAAGRAEVNTTHWRGTAVDTPTVAGVPNVNAKTWNDLTTVALPLAPTTAGRSLDVSTGGEAGLDWANIGSPTTTVGLSGTTISTSQVAASVTAAILLPTIPTDWITANGIATDAIGSAEIAATAVTKIQSGLATPTNITAATGIVLAGVTHTGAVIPTVTTTGTATALGAAYDAAKTASQAGDAMTLTSGERTTLAASLWNALTSGMTTVGSIGKKLADWVIGAPMQAGSTVVLTDASLTTAKLGAFVIAKGTNITGFNDLSAAQVTTAATAATPTAAAVTGAVGSVTAAITLPTIPTDWITAAGIATDAIGSAEVSAAAVTKIQAGLATPTNITAGTITTTTNLTNLPAITTGWLTATGIAADAITDAKVASDVTIASVTGAVGSVTGAVGSVTAAILLPTMPTDWLTAAGLKADAVAEIQSGLATPTNITAATGIVLAGVTHTGAVIPTVTTTGTATNLTNAPTVGDLTATMKASVTAAATAATPTAAAVTGAVGSVTAAVLLPTMPTDWLTAAGLKADAVTEIQTGLATPTNITAGTITTVTTLTNLPAITAGWLTAAGIAADAITAAKIADGAIDAATFAAGAINAAAIASDAITDAKVASDVTIASVTGAVGSVTAAVLLPTMPTDWLTAAGLKADAVTKIQAGLATPTNITAATGIVLSGVTHTGAVIPTVTAVGTTTNSTNAPTAGDLTAAMKTSVTTAATAATPNLNAAYNLAKTAAQAGDAMTLTSGERTTLTGVFWNALTSGMTTVGSIGKKFADWVIGTTQTGDSFALIGTTGSGLTSLASQSSADTAQVDITTLVGRLTASRAMYLDNLSGGTIATQADINALNQSASRRIVMTTVGQFERPESGSITRTVEIRTYDPDGAASNATGTPTLTATGNVTGSLAANIGTIANPATGVYRWEYTISSAATIEQIRFDVSAVVFGDTLPMTAYSQVVDLVSETFTTADRTKIAAIFDKLPVNNIGDQTLLTAAVGSPMQAGSTVVLTDASLTTAKLGAFALAKTSNITGFNDLSAAQVNTEADTALVDVGLTTTITGRIDVASSTRATPTNITAGTITTVGTVTNAILLPTMPTDWLTAAGLKADAVTEIQAGLATPTNITAATGVVLAGVTHTGAVIPTVTNVGTTANLTNAPTAGDLTATMKTSVTTAATAATPNLNAAYDAAKTAATQASVDDIPTNSEFNARTLVAAEYFDPAADTVIVGTNNDKTGYALAQAFPSNFAALGINASGHVSRVVLVDTTTTNTDMRGTNGANTTTPPTVAAIRSEMDANSTKLIEIAADTDDLQVSVDALPTNAELATALGTADDAVLAAIAALNNLSSSQVSTLLTALAATLSTNHGSGSWATADVSALATAAALAAVKADTLIAKNAAVVGLGTISNAGTADESYVYGGTTVTFAGLDQDGNRSGVTIT